MASLTDTQTRYLALAWLCFDAEPKIDYEKFAQLAGLKSSHSGREMLRVTKKRLMDFAPPSTTDGTVAPPNTPAAKTLRKKATPKTKSVKGKAGKKRKVASDSDDSENDEDTPLKKKKKPVVKNEAVDEDSDARAGAGVEVDSDEA